MNNDSSNEIKQIIEQFNESMTQHLPVLESEVDTLITSETKDVHDIESYLDTLLSLTMHGIADDLFIRLLEYYKTVDTEGALFYWNEYDNTDE